MTKDRLKEEIGFDKLLMTIASAMLSSFVGWIFNNVEIGLSLTMILMFLLTLVFLGVILFLFNNINYKIRELDL
mgnify:CR=1 FL=1